MSGSLSPFSAGAIIQGAIIQVIRMATDQWQDFWVTKRIEPAHITGVEF
jgi:hypothetical protein